MVLTEQDVISVFHGKMRASFEKYGQVIKLREAHGYGPRRLAKMFHLPKGMVGHWIYDGCKPLILRRIEALRRRKCIPLCSSSELAQCLARLSGYVLGDGTLRKRSVIFYGDEETLLNILEDVIRHLRLSGHISARKNTYELAISDVTLATLLYVLGIPYGDRVSQPFDVLRFVYNGDTAITRAFLQGLSDAELRGLSLRTERGFSVASIYLRMHKVQEYVDSLKSFLTNVGRLFRKLDIDYSKVSEPCHAYTRKDGKRTYSITLYLCS